MIHAVGLAVVLAAISPVVLAAGPVGASPRPQPRIVSINPCVDAILMHVADAGQIAAISHYSKDPRATSIPMAQAARFAATSGTAEEVVALAPDLVTEFAEVKHPFKAGFKAQKGVEY